MPSYVVINSRQTVQVLTQTQSIDVEAVTIATVPHNVNLIVPVPLVQWQAGNEAGYLTPPAEIVEQLLQGGIVTRCQWVQSTDTSDLLAGFVRATVTYQSTTGLSQAFSAAVLIPMTALVSFDAFAAWLGADNVDPINVTYNRLASTAGAPASALLA